MYVFVECVVLSLLCVECVCVFVECACWLSVCGACVECLCVVCVCICMLSMLTHTHIYILLSACSECIYGGILL